MAPEAKARAPWSLRRRLLGAIVAASVALWLAGLGIVTAIAWRETNDVFDDALEESGYMILAATSDWSARGLPGRLGAGKGPARKVDMQYQVVAGGRVLQRTAGAPARPFVAASGAAIDADEDDGFADVDADGQRWRVFVVRDTARRIEVQVGQRHARRFDILEELAESLWLTVPAFLALLALACWFVIGRVLAPLRRTAAGIAAKTPDDLAHVATAGQPRELLPVVTALNGVLERLDSALQAERRFTADAAHELRTPLAGLDMHAQLLQRQHPDLAAPFRKLRQDIARITALVDSLLALARLDPLARGQLACRPVALAPLLARLLDAGAAEAARRAIRIDLRLDIDTVRADPHLLEIALRNLLDNALRYCPPGSRIEIGASACGHIDRIAVRDDGAGVGEADRRRLAERFFRVLGQEAGGSGLGLSIVKRIADLHGSALVFGPGLDGRGLGVTLDLPRAPDAP